MPRLTTEQVIGLAPDPAGASAGRELAAESKWVTSGSRGDAVWGEAKGSGKLPYQTAVDLTGIAYKCSCPSRKIPCKHALGLLLRHAQGQVAESQVGEDDPPNWVAEWLDKRSAKKTEASPSTPDPDAAAARAEKRQRNILDGLDECEAFLIDAVAQGLLAKNSTRTWDQMAARMVDAQAPGIASRLRRIGSQIGVGPDWADRVVPQMGSLSLLVQAARSLERLDASLQADVKSALGISVRKDDLGGEPVTDIWDVMGQASEIEDRLTVFRTWMRGRNTGRWALHLAFAVGGQGPGELPVPGTARSGAVRYYESAWPLRVQVEVTTPTAFHPPEGGNWEEAFHFATDGWSKSPWIDLVPVHLSQATLGTQDGRYVAIDSDGKAAPVVGPSHARLLAVSGNSPSELFGEWDGRRLKLLAAWGPWGAVTV